LAGLQPIPDDLYEAADVDGATRWQKLIHITLPLLRPVILVSIALRTIGAFRVFDIIYVLTGNGGPADSTKVILVLRLRPSFPLSIFWLWCGHCLVDYGLYDFADHRVYALYSKTTWEL